MGLINYSISTDGHCQINFILVVEIDIRKKECYFLGNSLVLLVTGPRQLAARLSFWSAAVALRCVSGMKLIIIGVV